VAGGAFLISREIFENPIWRNVVEFRLFFLILGNAIFAEEGYKVDDTLTLQRGQWLRSTRKLQEDLQYIENRQIKTYATSTINNAIRRLVKLQRICTKTHELGTVFTVQNYEYYQDFSSYLKGELGTQLGTVTEQTPNNNNKDNKDNKDSNKSSSSKKIYEEDSTYYKAALYLKEKIRDNMRLLGKEHLLDNTNLQSWADDFRLMLEKDKIDKKELITVIDWCTQDSFWKTNILSASKLRKQYQTLVVKMMSEGKGAAHPKKKSKASSNMEFFTNMIGGIEGESSRIIIDSRQSNTALPESSS